MRSFRLSRGGRAVRSRVRVTPPHVAKASIIDGFDRLFGAIKWDKPKMRHGVCEGPWTLIDGNWVRVDPETGQPL